MKRFLLIFCLTIVHFFGAITFHIASQSFFAGGLDSSLSKPKSDKPENHQNHLWNSRIVSVSGEENILIHLGFNFQETPTRTNTSTEQLARLRNFKQLVNQKLRCRYKVNAFRLANSHFNGYYIYHLRKLLI